MKDYYSVAQAASVLGVSRRQVFNYLQSGELSRILQGNKGWIPKNEVDGLYHSVRGRPVARQEDIDALTDRVKQLERSVKVLSMALGDEGRKPRRTEEQLDLIKQEAQQLLTMRAWETADILKLARTTLGLKHEEVELLLRVKGRTAWLSLIDCLRRMSTYCERHPNYPEAGMGLAFKRAQSALEHLLEAQRDASNTLGMPAVYESPIPLQTLEDSIILYIRRKRE